MRNHLGKSVILCATLLLMGLAIASSAEAQRRKPDVPKEKKVSHPRDVRYISMHRMAGCGLGSLAFDSDEKLSQVGASLLNLTGLQSFAIAFGTSNCTYDGVAEAARERQVFVESNLADLNRDITLGEGEYISALAALYGCEGENKGIFTQHMRQHSQEILSNGADAQKILGLASDVLSRDQRLQRECVHI